MKTQLSRVGCLALTITVAMTGDRQTQAQSNVYNTFTYQGRITSDFGPGWDDSPHTWEFLFKAVIPPYPCADIIDCPWRTNCPNCSKFVLSTNSVLVNQGLFTTPIAISPALLDSSNGVFLEISVRTNSNQPFTTLSPLQPLTATPFATVAQSVSGPIPASLLTGTMPTGLLTGTFGSPLYFSNPNNIFAGDGSLLANVNAATIGGLGPCDLPCYWKTNGNTGTDPNVSFLGTIDEKALTIRVHNSPALRILPTDIGPSIVGGHPNNTIIGGSSVIAGGGTLAQGPNTIVADWSAIVGGVSNLITARDSIIGAGLANRIVQSGGTNVSEASIIGGGTQNVISNGYVGVIGGGSANRILGKSQGTIGGGGFNLVTGELGTVGGGGNNWAGQEAVVGAGFGNHALGRDSTIGGGSNNVASGFASTMAGGQNNSAFGHYSAIGGGIGHANTANYTTIGGGFQNLAAGQDAVVAGGSQNSATAGQSSIGGGIANTVSGSSSTIAGGQQNNASTLAASIGGGEQNRISDGADYSALGGGSRNFIGQRILDLIEFGFQTNHAYVAVLNGGINNTNIGYYSTLGGGQNNTIVGPANNVEASHAVIAGGRNNQVSSINAGTVGGGRDNHSEGDYSVVPGGRSGVADHYGQFAFAAGHMDHLGDAQASLFVLRRKFSGNGDLFLNGDTSDARIMVPIGSVWTLHFQISAVSVSGTNFGSYEVSGVIANLSGTPTFQLMDGSGAVVGTARPIYETPGAVPWLATPYLNADTSLRVAVFAGEMVKWCARIDVAEVRR